MKRLIVCSIAITLGTLGLALAVRAGADMTPGDAPPPMPAEKPALGDKDDITFQNQRYLTVKNDTAGKLTVFLQYRTLKDGAWTWLPDDPKDAQALSFELEAGRELAVQASDEPLSASRMRIWATGENQKWLKHKTADLWLVPERNEDGEHVYAAEAMETYVFTFAAKAPAAAPDSEEPAGTALPSEEGGMPLPDPLPPPGTDPLPGPDYPPWDEVPPGDSIPVVRDLAVMKVNVSGNKAVIRVRNKGHFALNLGRRLMVRKMAPGSIPVDLGPVGPLFHNAIRTYNAVNLAPGAYRAYISPGDNSPFDGNDERTFDVAAASFSDLRVQTVAVVGDKVNIKVKNVGTEGAKVGQRLKVVKMVPGAIPVDHGLVGALAVNDDKSFLSFSLAPGKYKAFISPGDAAPHHVNDFKVFIVSAVTFVDLDILPIPVVNGVASIKVKNIGTEAAPAGRKLMVVENKPGAVPVDHGPIGALGINGIKPFAGIALPAGNYKAYVSPGDAPPQAANDSAPFVVLVAAKPDLAMQNVVVAGGMVHVKVKNVGPGAAAAGRHLMVVKNVPGAIPVDKGPIGALAPGKTKVFAGFALAPGSYKAFVSPGDAAPLNGNDDDTFVVAPAPVADLQVSLPSKVGTEVHGSIKNTSLVPYVPGARTWHIEKWNGFMWNAVPTMGSHVIPMLLPGATHPIEGTFVGAGNYRIRITGGDGDPADDVKTKVLP